eukprot:TRINITY_DN5454_c0_g1_i2.p1 TRINITY_DN5454_c0_g1~~TRINITY_DN5454_c0_g1_i2.p1  ORF type:complete len:732 (-),score=218.81 TRINITY_DN5454_c0_g1_i2:728-2923(-)
MNLDSALQQRSQRASEIITHARISLAAFRSALAAPEKSSAATKENTKIHTNTNTNTKTNLTEKRPRSANHNRSNHRQSQSKHTDATQSHTLQHMRRLTDDLTDGDVEGAYPAIDSAILFFLNGSLPTEQTASNRSDPSQGKSKSRFQMAAAERNMENGKGTLPNDTKRNADNSDDDDEQDIIVQEKEQSVSRTASISSSSSVKTFPHDKSEILHLNASLVGTEADISIHAKSQMDKTTASEVPFHSDISSVSGVAGSHLNMSEQIHNTMEQKDRTQDSLAISVDAITNSIHATSISNTQSQDKVMFESLDHPESIDGQSLAQGGAHDQGEVRSDALFATSKETISSLGIAPSSEHMTSNHSLEISGETDAQHSDQIPEDHVLENESRITFPSIDPAVDGEVEKIANFSLDSVEPQISSEQQGDSSSLWANFRDDGGEDKAVAGDAVAGDAGDAAVDNAGDVADAVDDFDAVDNYDAGDFDNVGDADNAGDFDADDAGDVDTDDAGDFDNVGDADNAGDFDADDAGDVDTDDAGDFDNVGDVDNAGDVDADDVADDVDVRDGDVANDADADVRAVEQAHNLDAAPQIDESSRLPSDGNLGNMESNSTIDLGLSHRRLQIPHDIVAQYSKGSLDGDSNVLDDVQSVAATPTQNLLAEIAELEDSFPLSPNPQVSLGVTADETEGIDPSLQVQESRTETLLVGRCPAMQGRVRSYIHFFFLRFFYLHENYLGDC